MEKKHNDYYDQFLTTLPLESPLRKRPVTAEGWGNSPEMADELGHLIAEGIKTATCSAQWEWEFDQETWPEPGHLTIVLDGRGDPLCIIELTEVRILPFNQVDAQFAYEEGEGDRSLSFWREAHLRFFVPAMQRIGRPFSEDLPLVCERFRVIHR
jgi:uncharacterized protein YhfF